MMATSTSQRWTTATLGDVARIERSGIAPEQIQSGTTYVGLENIASGGSFVGVGPVSNGELASTKFVFSPRHVLYGKLRPYLAKIACPDFDGVCSTDILPILPGEQLDRRYLCYFLRQPHMVQFATSRCSGANLPRLSPNQLANFEIPLPPLSEQRRIADILDKADAIRRKRREAVEQVVRLREAAFREIFGNLSRNEKKWPLTEFRHVLTEQGFRNGVSPSRAGGYLGKVLVLSAVTGSQFDKHAVKEGTFASPAREEQLVSANDFLICRGNGNIRLVGVGQFPTSHLSDTVFPDTIIAAPIDRSQITPQYLQEAWRSTCIRSQIESGARTTNGTHKINQGVLGGIAFPLPPHSEQQRFAQASDRIASMITQLQTGDPNTLFDSLTQRAFRGDL